MSSPDMSLEEAQARVAQKTAPRVTKEGIQDRIEDVRYVHDGTGTFCIIRMTNGFEVNGFSKPADPRNYDIDVGDRYAYENAFRQLWQLEGYLLCERLARGDFATPARPEEAFPSGLHTYRSHKVVIAGKIDAMVEGQGGALLSIGPMTVKAQWSYLDRVPEKAMDRAVGGYYVQYQDGYQSWSPAEAFESGYELEANRDEV